MGDPQNDAVLAAVELHNERIRKIGPVETAKLEAEEAAAEAKPKKAEK